jgi:hypothetical protein
VLTCYQHSRTGRLTSIAYETKRCGCDCKVRAYLLSGSPVLLAKFWNNLRIRYLLDPFLVVTGSHCTRWEVEEDAHPEKHKEGAFLEFKSHLTFYTAEGSSVNCGSRSMTFKNRRTRAPSARLAKRTRHG